MENVVTKILKGPHLKLRSVFNPKRKGASDRKKYLSSLKARGVKKGGAPGATLNFQGEK